MNNTLWKKQTSKEFRAAHKPTVFWNNARGPYAIGKNEYKRRARALATKGK